MDGLGWGGKVGSGSRWSIGWGGMGMVGVV